MTPAGAFDSDHGFDWVDAGLVAPQLKFVAIHEFFSSWLTEVLQSHAATMTRLEELWLSTPVQSAWGHRVPWLLERPPHALTVLDIAASPFGAECAGIVADAFEQSRASVEGLKVLRLPAFAGLVLHEGESGVEVMVQLGRVVRLAEERGVRVEWV